MEHFKTTGESGVKWNRNTNVMRVLGSNFVSFFGDQMYIIALPLIVLALTGSPLAMGIVAALERIAIFLQPFTGVLADHYDRKKLLLICDSGRFFIVGIMGILGLTAHLAMWQIYIGAFVIGVFNQLYQTSQFATLPGFVHKRDLSSVNAVNTGIRQLSVLTAPALAGAVIGLYQPGVALMINSLAFLTGFIMMLRLPVEPPTAKTSNISIIKEIKEGAVFVFKQKPIFFTNLAMFFSVFGTTLFLTMMIVHLKSALHFTAVEIGWVLSAGGMGAILGAFSILSIRKLCSVRTILFSGGTIGGLSIIFFSFGESVWLLGLMNAIGACTAAMLSPCIVTIRQQLSPDHLLGRVQATSRWMTWILMPVAAFLSGLMGEWIGTSVTLGIGGIIAFLASFIYLHPSLANISAMSK